ncbi:hypothetical protein [Aliiroseovarius subalbicans]|uniref:hypothetical protein n=1 Tax=Aliiroseovarius subalbicans TaxID=2925840 RepID=UPI001F5619F7|nr:hypothetical protein [Aliiroseovarius subalbicans]MCI2397790.1 hypothetical protein [Aliiroseovarius subalbicans]
MRNHKTAFQNASYTFLLLFIVTTAASQATTSFHYSVMVLVRSVGLAALTVILVLYLLKASQTLRVSRQVFALGIVYSFLLFWGLGFSLFTGGFSFFVEDRNLPVFLAISVVYGFALLALLTGFQKQEGATSNVISPLLLYFFTSFLTMVAAGGVSPGFPPRIMFGQVNDVAISYSQGFSGFYAMGGVFLYSLANDATRGVSLFFFTSSVVFFSLSMLGGARGDFLAGIIALAFFVLRNPRFQNIVVIGGAALLALVYVFQSGIWEDIVVFKRLLVLADGNFGQRDILADQAISLLREQPVCLALGCGFNFFQSYWGFEYGLYPHNAFLEAVVTFGLPVGGGLVLLSLLGLAISFLGWGARNPVFYLLLVQYLTMLKSGSLLGFTSLPLLVVFAMFGFDWLIRRPGLPVENHFRQTASPALGNDHSS